MKFHSISQEQINKVLAYRNERINYLETIKSDEIFSNSIRLQILAIEGVLLTLGFEFKESNVDYIF